MKEHIFGKMLVIILYQKYYTDSLAWSHEVFSGPIVMFEVKDIIKNEINVSITSKTKFSSIIHAHITFFNATTDQTLR